MEKNSANCVTNPVPAKQIVDVNLEWGTLTPPECTDLISTLQTILDELNAVKEFEVDLECLENTEVTIQSVIQTLITKQCELEGTNSTDPTDSTFTIDIELCQVDGWVKEDPSCIVLDPCGDTPTTEEIIQGMVNRINTLTNLHKEMCTRIEELETQIENMEESECCAQATLDNLQSQITLINNQLSNGNP